MLQLWLSLTRLNCRFALFCLVDDVVDETWLAPYCCAVFRFALPRQAMTKDEDKWREALCLLY
ncbi:MAG: hypothetical protein IIX82_03405, partial [Alistipes sp.]|nr:hypothetical protein [Alistipes sp.]